MKLTKKIETEISKVYDTWLHAYLNGDVATYDKYLDKDYHFIGSTDNEEFLSKKDTTSFFEKTADQLAGKCDLRNEARIIEQFEGLVFITHLFDAWFKNGEDWTYYGRFRFSNVLKQNKEGWRFIYQHFSTTDSKAQDGETIGFDQISAENLKLREAIQRRTVELEAKNRELEIEGALERIRAQAVAMKTSSDLLDIVVSMRNEFTKLGHEAHYFWHMMWLPETYEKAMTSGDGTKIGFVMKLPRHIHGDIPLLAKWEKSKKPTVVHAMNVEDALDYIHKMVTLGDFQNIDPQAPTENDIRHIGGLTFVMARTTHGEIGYSLPGVVKNPPKEDIDILVKFASAFDLAHQRFLDLQKAEKQARETQIELALEKVRSRTMAMQKSEELADVATVLFQQVKELGIPQWTCGFNIWETGDTEFTFYPGGPDGEILPSSKVPLLDHPIFRQFDESKRRGDELFVYEKEGEVQTDHYQYMHSLPGIGDMLQGMLDSGLEFPEYQIDHVVNFKYGNMIFITYEPFPEMHEVFKRFAKVFEQTYTRFLDLQKAEAQAREAQIETALERVRARSMGMHSSSELKDVIREIFDQMRQINISAEHAGIVVDYEPKKDWHFWVAETQDIPAKISVPYLGSVWDKQFTVAKKSGKALFTTRLNYEEKNTFYKEMLPHIEGLTEEMKDGYFKRKGLAITTALQRDIALYIENFSGTPYTDEENTILLRFAKVFQQTYTRFLDLKKAEAQAREAQIETALERVRSRTMAMQNSNELGEVILEVLKKLQDLDISMEQRATAIFTFESGNKDYEQWVASPEYNSILSFNTPYFDHPVQNDIWNARQNGIGFYAKSYTVEEKNSLFNYIFDLPALKNMPQAEKTKALQFKHYNISIAFGKNAALVVVSHSGIPLTKAENTVIQRLSKVFEQTYTRFLDLQKAEAQAREAQIEATLERVRSQSMGMQTSADLSKVTTAMFEQLRQLGGNLFAAGIVFCDKHKGHVEQWHSLPDAGMISPFIVPIDLDYIHQYRYDEWKKGTELFSVEIPSDFIEQHFQDIFNLPSAQKVLKDFEDQNTPMPETPPWEIDYGASFKHGYLLVSSLEHFKEAEILPRFAKVFEQTYTRFLDLQKAEAQARESQIEMALEKVRSRTMAMQKSEELPEAANNLFLQVQALGIPAWSAGYCIWENNTKKSTWCNMSSEGEIQKGFSLPTMGEGYDFYTPLKKGKDFYVAELGGKELVKHYDFMKKLPIVGEVLEDFDKKGIDLPTFQIFHIVYFSHGYLMFITYEPVPNDWDIFKRFGKVFQQTYTRFLDLQKAEEQTRKAQIEASLERVRARAMAMHDSNELDEVLSVLCEQFDVLGILPMSTHMTVLDFENNTFTFRETGKFGNRSFGEQTVALDAMDNWKETVDKWKADKATDINKLHFAKEQLPKVWEVFHESFASMPEGSRITPKDYPDGIYHTAGKHPFGYIGMNQTRPATEEEQQIVIKFANEFGRAYQRFLDLQKAEAQAREAQIEAALERVRSRSMAMHKSDEMLEVIEVVAKQLLQLNLKFDTVSFGKNSQEGDFKFWIASKGQPKPLLIQVPFLDSPVLNSVKKAQKEGVNFIEDVFTAKENKQWSQHLIKFSELKQLPEVAKDYILNAPGFARSSFLLKSINLYVANYRAIPFTKEDNVIFSRFAHVFEQAYTRFLDLQKAEAQARESQIETALEKVRSRTMAMQHSDELPEAANTLFLEVQGLGIPSWSCGFNVLSEDKKSSSSWMSSEGQIQKPFKLRFEKEASFIEMYNFFKSDKDFLLQELDGKAIENHYNYLKSIPGLSTIFYELESKGISHPTYQINHLCKFNKGYLLFITYEKVPEAHDLFKRFTNVFEQTYTRFLDLQNAESLKRKAEEDLVKLQKAKKRAEDALSELQLTQTQLIQSEKMASLGELTAGIAHEIQNPLNFVNNFSEVSKELLDEMLEEIENGDMEEVRAIMDDVIQNLEKINHHGKRADGIVKGMLQHSRSSSGVKELTDINQLVDEYLRLAYHGLRAKDKSFNATLETDFDNSIKTINIVPQDIGRVVLNLITNAFYACNEKKKLQLEGYEPKVTVETKKIKDTVEIHVEDNGNGIPKKVLDKIFQPFFTTKPTGQGTGLGLSMSYDIIKSHDGDIRVETEESKGTKFKIQLPIK